MALKGKRSSLAEKISSLVTAAPTSFNSDDEYDDTKAKLVEPDDEIASDSDIPLSKFRTRNLNLLDDVDKRYEGKKVSRKTLTEEPEDSDIGEKDDEDSDEELESNNDNDDESDASDVSEHSSGENDEVDSDDEPELDVDEANPLRRRDPQVESNFRHMSATDFGAEMEKGKCVRSQLGIWENLLEMRIKLQKCLISSNKMPQFDTHRKLRTDQSFSKQTNEAQKTVSKLLDNLLELQSTLLKSYPETKQLTKENKSSVKKNDNDDNDDEEIPSDTDDETMQKSEEPEEREEEEEEEEEKEEDGKEENESIPRKKRKLQDYESLISKNHNLYTSYRNSVIQKWNDKTRVAVGNVNNKGSTQPVVRQIEYILSDKSKLRKRTQLKRSEYEIIGRKESLEGDKDGRRVQEYDTEIYDDDDFYHQLLRELIEFKSADVTDPIQLSKQWIQLQNMRSKMKRKIDTKATKGRRIRFGVHSKLVNFMAPIRTDDLWSDEAKTELYNSLFGKIKEVDEK